MLHVRTGRPVDHITPCLPSRAERPPAGPGWLHEIKHDGFRLLARRNRDGVRLYTRNGYDFAGRFPQIVEAISKLKARSCAIDGEAVVVDDRGLSAFDLLRSWRHDHAAVLCAFDLLELDGRDLRRQPIEIRKAALAKLLKGSHLSIILNEHFEEDGALPGGVSARLRGYRFQAARLALSVWTLAALGKGQEPERASGEAGSRRGLGLVGT